MASRPGCHVFKCQPKQSKLQWVQLFFEATTSLNEVCPPQTRDKLAASENHKQVVSWPMVGFVPKVTRPNICYNNSAHGFFYIIIITYVVFVSTFCRLFVPSHKEVQPLSCHTFLVHKLNVFQYHQKQNLVRYPQPRKSLQHVLWIILPNGNAAPRPLTRHDLATQRFPMER